MLDVFSDVAGGSKTAYLSRILLSYVSRCFRLFFRATVKLLSTQCSEKPYKFQGRSTARRLGTNICCRAVVTASLFCYSPRVFEILRRAWESERLAE